MSDIPADRSHFDIQALTARIDRHISALEQS